MALLTSSQCMLPLLVEGPALRTSGVEHSDIVTWFYAHLWAYVQLKLQGLTLPLPDHDP